MTESTNTLIVGAGPIGLEVAHALQSEGIDHLHIDAGPIGATMGWWAPGTRFFSSPERIGICGVPIPSSLQEKTNREEYIAYLRAVAQQLGLRVRTHERLEAATREADGTFSLRTASTIGLPPGTIRARHLVLAIGNMHRPRPLGIEGEHAPGVSHYLRDPHEYYGRRVLIVGGKNSAVEAAIRLHRAGAQVAISYRREAFDPDRVKYWLLPELRWLIEKGRIAFHPSTVPQRLGGGSATLAPVAGGEPITVPAEMTLLLTGYEQDTTLFEQLGVELMGEERRPKFDHGTMRTSVPGVFVAGTATAGSERRTRVFIETSHTHAERIAAAIAGRPPAEAETPQYGRQEES